MSQSVDSPAGATPFLTYYFGGGLVDEGRCYVVERLCVAQHYKAMADRGIRRDDGLPGGVPPKRCASPRGRAGP